MKTKAGASHFSMVLVSSLVNVKKGENTENIVQSNARKKNALSNGKADLSNTKWPLTMTVKEGFALSWVPLHDL